MRFEFDFWLVPNLSLPLVDLTDQWWPDGAINICWLGFIDVYFSNEFANFITVHSLITKWHFSLKAFPLSPSLILPLISFLPLFNERLTNILHHSPPHQPAFQFHYDFEQVLVAKRGTFSFALPPSLNAFRMVKTCSTEWSTTWFRFIEIEISMIREVVLLLNGGSTILRVISIKQNKRLFAEKERPKE